MKHNLKRVFCTLLVSAMALSLLAGCGGSGATSTAPATPAAPAASASESTDATPAPTNGKAMSFWHIQTEEPRKTIIADSIDRYNAANPENPVEISIVANDAYKQKIAISMGSGTTPDIYTHWTGGPMIEYIKSGQCLDITEYMNKDGYKDRFLDAAIAQATYDGKIYAVPVEDISIVGVFYNKTMFDNLSIAVPETLTELEAACDTLLANNITPFALANATKWTGSMYYMSLATRDGGLQPFKDAAAGTGTFEDPCFEFAGTKLQDWVNKGYFNEGFNGLDEDSGQAKQLMYQEKAAMQCAGSWMVSTYKGDSEEFYKNVGWFSFPSIEGKEANGSLTVGTIGNNDYSVAPSCATPEKAFEAITYLLDDTAIEERLAAGRIPPLKGIQDKLTDPNLLSIMEIVDNATDVQLWYDQYLPPEVAEVHKSTSQEIFGLAKTPAQANTEMQDAMQAYLAKQ